MWFKENRRIIIGAAIVFVVLIAGLIVASDVAAHRTVPNVSGMLLSEATDLLKAEDLNPAITYAKGDEKVREQFLYVDKQSVAAGEFLRKGSSVIVDVSAIEVTVPSFTNMLFTDALVQAWDIGVKLRNDSNEGSSYARVISQDVPSGTRIKADSTAVTVLTEVPEITVPDLLGGDLEAAITELSDLALDFKFNCECVRSGDLVVESMSPVPGRIVEPGSTIELTAGVKVPDLVGMELSAARDATRDAKLNLTIEGNSNRSVTSQSVPAGTIVKPQSSVTVNVGDIMLEYRVTGNGSTAMVTWSPPGSFSISQDTAAALPWTQSFPRTSSSGANFNAQILDGDSVTCQVLFDGKVVKESTSTGMYAVVSCG